MVKNDTVHDHKLVSFAIFREVDTLLQIFKKSHARIKISMDKGVGAMIELIYNEEKGLASEAADFREPKNLRQVGESPEHKKIYMEDYVHTFLKQYALEGENSRKIAVLLGKSECCEDGRRLMIKSAFAVEGIEEREGKYAFTEQIWGEIYQKCKEYFSEQEIIGWALSRYGFPAEKDGVIEQTHRTYFSGADKVLFLLEPVEDETAFFAFDGNCFLRQRGYYIYYEKNEPMQNYLIRRKESCPSDITGERPDTVMINFRKILKEKQEEKKQKKKKVFSYGARSAVLLLLFVTAVTWKNRGGFWEASSKTEETMKIQEEQAEEVFTGDVVLEELPGQITMEEVRKEENVQELPVLEEEPEAPLEEEAKLPETYVVQKGDTLVGICRNYYGDEQMLEEICRLNGITDVDYIQVGETILLP